MSEREELELIAQQPAANKTILVVDDDPSICDMMTSLLNRSDIQVISTVRSNEALTYMVDGSVVAIDLLITDLQMPGAGGFSIIKDLQSEKYKKVPILVVTGRNLDAQAIAMIKLEPNVVDVVLKPISTREFVAKVHDLLGVPRNVSS